MGCRSIQEHWNHRRPGSSVVPVWPLVRTKVEWIIFDQRLLQMQLLCAIHVGSFVF